jgi:hypothetical protein
MAERAIHPDAKQSFVEAATEWRLLAGTIEKLEQMGPRQSN